MLINNYRIVPVSGGGACLVGEIEGRGQIQTTEIALYRKGEIKTKSGNHYHLGTKHPSLWPAQLQMRRPDLFEKFDSAGIL